jgi:hypothetical protein
MRARDVRAIAFCTITIAVVAACATVLLRSYLAGLALAAACAAWLLTRPRMVRVFRRLRGQPDWSGYYDDRGTRFTPRPGPGRAASPPHPAERL